MLSRVAESMYWMSRYIERAENMARVVSVNGNLQLDLPRGVAPGWKPIVDITGANADFEKSHRAYGERQVVRFLLGDRHSPSSVRCCISNARENCRTMREILPREAWQYLTELQLFVDENLATGLTRSGRQPFIDRIIRTCQMTMGLLGSVMTRDVGYQFLRLGRNLERADMTTRFIDIRPSVSTSDKAPDPAALATTQWVSVLGSLSAYHMYRRKMRALVEREHVLWFLLKDDEFPRSFMHCLNAIEESLGTLDHGHPCLVAVRKVVNEVGQANTETLTRAGIPPLVDRLQRGLIEVHDTVARMYFLQAPAEA
ncbi:MAG: alpha-E domain-containing protein [Gammaproteobacteria bacterium]